MKIAICIKQVPVVSMLRFDNESRRVVREGVPNEVNPFDVLAVSAVAELKRHTDVEAVVYTMGPPQADEALVQCLAMGMDRAVHLVDRAFAGSDTLATARALALALRRESFDLILCGRNSVDAETGQVGPEIAEMLGLPQVTGVRRLELDAQAGQVIVERETDEGHERLLCPLPALLTVTEGVAPRRFPAPTPWRPRAPSPSSSSPPPTCRTTRRCSAWTARQPGSARVYSEESDRDAIVVRNEPVDAAVARLMEYLEERGVFDDADDADGAAIPRGPLRQRGEPGSIWVVAELLGGEVRPVTLELLGRATELATRLGTNVEAVLIGDAAERHAALLAAHGADIVRLADDPRPRPLRHREPHRDTRPRRGGARALRRAAGRHRERPGPRRSLGRAPGAWPHRRLHRPRPRRRGPAGPAKARLRRQRRRAHPLADAPPDGDGTARHTHALPRPTSPSRPSFARSKSATWRNPGCDCWRACPPARPRARSWSTPPLW